MQFTKETSEEKNWFRLVWQPEWNFLPEMVYTLGLAYVFRKSTSWKIQTNYECALFRFSPHISRSWFDFWKRGILLTVNWSFDYKAMGYRHFYSIENTIIVQFVVTKARTSANRYNDDGSAIRNTILLTILTFIIFTLRND